MNLTPKLGGDAAITKDAPRKAISDYNIKQFRSGIWDIYGRSPEDGEKKPQKPGPDFVQMVPYLRRYTREVIDAGGAMLIVYVLASMVSSLFPAASIYFSGELLNMVSHCFRIYNR